MIELRPHHFLCLLTYTGKGYSEAFIANFDQLAPRILAGETVRVTYGPDSVCRPRLADPDDEHHCHAQRIAARDLAAFRALATLNLSLYEGRRLCLTPSLLAEMRSAFLGGNIRQACCGCQWYSLCSSVANRWRESGNIAD